MLKSDEIHFCKYIISFMMFFLTSYFSWSHRMTDLYWFMIAHGLMVFPFGKCHIPSSICSHCVLRHGGAIGIKWNQFGTGAISFWLSDSYWRVIPSPRTDKTSWVWWYPRKISDSSSLPNSHRNLCWHSNAGLHRKPPFTRNQVMFLIQVIQPMRIHA